MNVLKAFVFAALLAVPGCATVGVKAPDPLPVPAALSSTQRAAAIAVNESFVHVAAGYSLIELLANGRLAPKAELQGYLEKLDAALKGAVAARKLYEGGDILSAQNQAELLNKGLVLLLKELNERKGKA